MKEKYRDGGEREEGGEGKVEMKKGGRRKRTIGK